MGCANRMSETADQFTSPLVHLENSPGMDDKPNSLEFFL